MAKYISKNQMIVDIGEHFVGYLISSKLNVIYRPISKRDTGIDGEIELTEFVDDTKFKATGIFIKVQIKSSTIQEFVNGKVTIYLSEDDINYFTSDINLPGILLFVDLKSEKQNVYWKEISPIMISKNNSIVISKRNVINSKTSISWKKLESFYKSARLREELNEMFKKYYNLILSHIYEATSEDGLGYVLSSLYENLTKVIDVYSFTYVKNMNNQDIPDDFNLFSDYLKLTNKMAELKNIADKILSEKGLNTFNYYKEECFNE